MQRLYKIRIPPLWVRISEQSSRNRVEIIYSARYLTFSVKVETDLFFASLEMQWLFRRWEGWEGCAACSHEGPDSLPRDRTEDAGRDDNAKLVFLCAVPSCRASGVALESLHLKLCAPRHGEDNSEAREKINIIALKLTCLRSLPSINCATMGLCHKSKARIV